MIEFQTVTHTFKKQPVLNEIELKLSEKKIGIIGNNGSGKTTFLRLINGLQLPSKGDVLIDGLNTRTSTKIIRKKVGFVFQNPDHQIVFPTVFEDLSFGLKNLNTPKEIIDQKVNLILKKYDLIEFKNYLIDHLSGGQKQLIALLGVIIMEPNYLILDEPTAFLDLRNRTHLMDILMKLPQNLIVVSHDLNLLTSFDRIIVLDKGVVVYDGSPDVSIAHYYNLVQAC